MCIRMTMKSRSSPGLRLERDPREWKLDAFINQNQYAIAWLVYVVAGLAFCLFWWKVTSFISHGGWRDLLRGISLIVIFTPWYVSDAHEHFAPATVVVLMDLLLGSTENGLAGSMALLVATTVMLAALILRRLLWARLFPGELRPRDGASS